MADGVPAGRDESVAALPRKVLVADRGFAHPFGHVEDDIGGGAIAPRVAADRQPFHREPTRRQFRGFPPGPPARETPAPRPGLAGPAPPCLPRGTLRAMSSRVIRYGDFVMTRCSFSCFSGGCW